MEDHRQILSPFQRKQLEHKLTQPGVPKLLRQRIEIMLLADEGKTQREICQILGCSVVTANRWMLFARAQFAHQWEDSPPGRPKKVSDEYIQRLQELVHSSPRDFGYPFHRWTASWLNKHLAKELGIELSDRHLSRLLKKLNVSTHAKEPSHKESDSLAKQGSNLGTLPLDKAPKSLLTGIVPNPITPIHNGTPLLHQCYISKENFDL